MTTLSLNLRWLALVALFICIWGGLLFLAFMAMVPYAPSLPLPGDAPLLWSYVTPFWCWLFFNLARQPQALIGMLVLTFAPPMTVAIQKKAYQRVGLMACSQILMFMYWVEIDFNWEYPYQDRLRFFYCLSAFSLTPITIPLVMSLYNTRIERIFGIGAYFGLMFYCPALAIIYTLGSFGYLCV